jgi:hypothetical protein
MEKKNTPAQSDSHDSHDVVGNWIFSLLPIGVAFVFYVVFIAGSNLEHANMFIAYGAAAAFIGLESYWIIYGLRNKYVGTVVMGLAGIAMTVGLLYLYLSYAA